MFYLSPSPSSTSYKVRGSNEHKYEVYDVKALTLGRHTLNVAATYDQQPSYDQENPPPIYAHRFITGRSFFALDYHNILHL